MTVMFKIPEETLFMTTRAIALARLCDSVTWNDMTIIIVRYNYDERDDRVVVTVSREVTVVSLKGGTVTISIASSDDLGLLLERDGYAVVMLLYDETGVLVPVSISPSWFLARGADALMTIVRGSFRDRDLVEFRIA